MRRAAPLGSIFTDFRSGAGGTFTAFHSSTMVCGKVGEHHRKITTARLRPMKVDLGRISLLNIFIAPPFNVHLSFPM
jgi:hypothetical protein